MNNPSEIFLSLYCAIIGIQMIVHFRDQLAFFRTEPERVYGQPPRLLGMIPFPRISERIFIWAGIAFTAAMIASASNIARKPSLVVALICFIIYFPPILPLAYIQRKINLIPLVLAAALLEQSQVQAVAQTGLSLVYLSAGAEKLRSGGWRWADGNTLQSYLIEHYLYTDRHAARFLGQKEFVCRVLSTAVLIWELSFWIILFFPFVIWVYAAVGLLFHAGTSIVMRIHYWIYFCPVYLVFVAPSLQHCFSAALASLK